MKNCFVKKYEAVIDNSNLPIVKEKIILFNTTISAGTNFDINLPAGTNIVTEVTNNSGQAEYLVATQRNSSDANIATIITGMSLAAGLKKVSESVIVEGCVRINVTVDAGKSNEVLIYYTKPV